jgi:S-adenosylmethionine synthetase
MLAQDPDSRVACETLVTTGLVVIAGEITSKAVVDLQSVARKTISDIGYNDPLLGFDATSCGILVSVHQQSPDISQGVTEGQGLHEEQGAGDQGIMFGYATDETPELMPLPILLAHRLARGLAEDRKNGTAPWLRPDGKTQVSVVYEDNRPIAVTNVIVSPQHSPSINREGIIEYVTESLAPRVLGDWFTKKIRFHVNPTGSFIHGGPSADAGVTGRKIIVDTYGGAGRHGGGAFSGKDPSKVDRSGAYFCRYIARQLVKQKLASKAEIQISYAIGEAHPLSVKVDTFGTGDAKVAAEFVKRMDFRPAAIIERFKLLRPIYRQTTNYGHFGKPGLPWEE